METLSVRDYESKVVMVRYMNIVAVILLLAFLAWRMSELTSGSFYFLAAVTAYMGFVVAKSCFVDRQYFGRWSDDGATASRLFSRVTKAVANVRGKPEVAAAVGVTAGGSRE